MAFKANSAIESSAAEPSSSRRTIIKGAAWSVPVIAVAAAAPAHAASGDPVIVPPAMATFWGSGATASVVSGNVTNYTLEGTDAEGDPAILPVGTTATITPEAGVTLVLVDFTIGTTALLNSDGTITLTVINADVTDLRLRFRPSGPSGSGYVITTRINIDPFTEDIEVKLR